MKIKFLFSVLALAVAMAGILTKADEISAINRKVVLVVLENADYNTAVQLPFLSKLIKNGALLTNYNGVIHPSQPNYFALTSGGYYGLITDATITVPFYNLADLVEQSYKHWRVYAEQYPGHCYTGARYGGYARKHNPFISYSDIQFNPERCAQIVNSSEFEKDYASGNLRDFSYYAPDMNNSGHDTTPQYADRWLQQTFGGALQNPAFLKDTLFIVTYDESETYLGDHVAAVMLGSDVIKGSSNANYYNHYDMLRTIEHYLNLDGTLNKKDAGAKIINQIWR